MYICCKQHCKNCMEVFRLHICTISSFEAVRESESFCTIKEKDLSFLPSAICLLLAFVVS